MNTQTALTSLLLLVFLTAACVPQPVIPVTGGEIPYSDSLAFLAERQSTINALETLLAFTPSPLPGATITPSLSPSDTPSSTPTLMPSSTLLPTLTPSPLPTASSTPEPTSVYAGSACNLAEFVADLTIPDGSVVTAGSSFVKTWRVRNTGSCTWTRDYRIVSVGPKPLGGPAYSILGIPVAPGQTIDLSLALTAPAAAGTYQTLYMLQDANGSLFGTGSDGNSALDVLIVNSAPAPLAVTHVDLSVNTTVASVICPPGYPFVFSAAITSSAPGDIKFHWIFGDGTTTAPQTLTYSAAGSQTVSAMWWLGKSGTLPSNPYTATTSLYIDEPNHQTFGAQPVAIACILPTPTP
jgi:hypothetical protein